MDRVQSALRELGLSSKESLVYCALLELGQTPVLRLSEVTMINRTTLYDLLKSLVQKGLAGFSKNGRRFTFHASPPDILLESFAKKTEQCRRILPELKAKMSSIGKRPTVEFYEGSRGIDTVYEDILESRKTVLQYGSFSITQKTEKYNALQFRKQRILRKIPTVAVTDKSILTIPEISRPEYRKLTTLFINDALAKMPTWTYVYGTKISVMSIKKKHLFGFVIDDPALAKKERQIFDDLVKRSRCVLRGKK